MKRTLLFYTISLLLLTSCKTPQRLSDNEYLHLICNKQEVDSTKYIYLVDTISFDSVNFCLLAKEREHKGFYVHKSFLTKHKTIKDKDIINENYPIFLWDLIGYEGYGCAIFYDYNSGVPNNYKNVAISDGWIVKEMKVKPSFMRVYMMRGDFLLLLFCKIDGPYYGPFRFPINKKTYYKVLVPAWVKGQRTSS